MLEFCYDPYRNPWFLIKKKKKGKYRLINAAIKINKIIIRNINLPPSVDNFSENFVKCKIVSLVDFFSGYDQIELDEIFRDLTGFMTPIGLLKMTILFQKITNSVAQFVRVVIKILQDHIPKHCEPFLDDINIKKSKSIYDNQKTLPKIRRFILKYIQWLNRILADLERANCIISGAKSQFCMINIKIVGFICDAKKRHPDTVKIIKIFE